MRVLFLVAALFVAGVVHGEAPYDLASIQLWQEKDVNVAVQAFSKELADQQGTVGGFSLNISGTLYVEGHLETYNNLPPFGSLESLIAQVRVDYCHEEHPPQGTIFFKTKDPNLVPTVAVGHGNIKSLKNFNIRVGYGEGNREVVIYEEITCKF